MKCICLKVNESKNYLIDPSFRFKSWVFSLKLAHKDFYHSIDCVFLTHGHIDHTSGLSKIV